jgi:hypothetical protein
VLLATVTIVFVTTSVGGAVAIDELAVEPRLPAKTRLDPNSTEGQIAALQSQVQALQQQLAAFQAVVQITPTSVTLQGPSVTIKTGGGVMIESQNETTIKTGGPLKLQVSGPLDAKALTILLNGTKPVVTVNGTLQVGSQTVFAG